SSRYRPYATQPLSPRAFWWTKATRLHRSCAGRGPTAPNSGRGCFGVGCLRSGADSQSFERPEARLGAFLPVHYPRLGSRAPVRGPRLRDVLGSDRRGSFHGGAVQIAVAPLYGSVVGGRAPVEGGELPRACAFRRCAFPIEPSERLPLSR